MRGVVAFATEQDEHMREEAAAANETWLAYPDDDPVRTATSGADTRAALMPLLAHQVRLPTNASVQSEQRFWLSTRRSCEMTQV